MGIFNRIKGQLSKLIRDDLAQDPPEEPDPVVWQRRPTIDSRQVFVVGLAGRLDPDYRPRDPGPSSIARIIAEAVVDNVFADITGTIDNVVAGNGFRSRMLVIGVHIMNEFRELIDANIFFRDINELLTKKLDGNEEYLRLLPNTVKFSLIYDHSLKEEELRITHYRPLNLFAARYMDAMVRKNKDIPDEEQRTKLFGIVKEIDSQGASTSMPTARQTFSVEQQEVGLLPISRDCVLRVKNTNSGGLCEIRSPKVGTKETLRYGHKDSKGLHALGLILNRFNEPVRLKGYRSITVKGNIQLLGYTSYARTGQSQYVPFAEGEYEHQLNRTHFMVFGQFPVGHGEQTILFDDWQSQEATLASNWIGATAALLLRFDTKQNLWQITPQNPDDTQYRIFPDRSWVPDLWKDPVGQYQALSEDGYVRTPTQGCYVAVKRAFSDNRWLILKINVGSRVSQTDAMAQGSSGPVDPQEPLAGFTINVGPTDIQHGVRFFLKEHGLLEDLSLPLPPVTQGMVLRARNADGALFYAKLLDPAHSKEYDTELVCQKLLDRDIIPREKVNFYKMNLNGIEDPDGDFIVVISKQMRSLESVFTAGSPPSDRERLRCMQQLAESIARIEGAEVVCVDLAIQNFVIDDGEGEGNLLCIDYGAYLAAASIGRKPLLRNQTFPLPEDAVHRQLSGRPYVTCFEGAAATQAYLLGIMLGQMATGEHGYAPQAVEEPISGTSALPWKDEQGSAFDLPEARQAAQAHGRSLEQALPLRLQRTLKDPALAGELAKLLCDLLRFDPRRRISIAAAVGRLRALAEQA